jgi:hypothetical protein
MHHTNAADEAPLLHHCGNWGPGHSHGCFTHSVKYTTAERNPFSEVLFTAAGYGWIGAVRRVVFGQVLWATRRNCVLSIRPAVAPAPEVQQPPVPRASVAYQYIMDAHSAVLCRHPWSIERVVEGAPRLPDLRK